MKKIDKDNIHLYYKKMNTQLNQYLMKICPDEVYSKDEKIYFHLVEKKIFLLLDLGRKNHKIIHLCESLLRTLAKLRKIELDLTHNK